jgi:methionine synthase I (cobalamin-dependent)
MGTRLYDKGVYINRSYDELNLVAPDLVREVHEEYVNAGADIIETNSSARLGTNFSRTDSKQTEGDQYRARVIAARGGR